MENNNKMMKVLAIACIFACCMAGELIPYRGLMVAYTKSNFAKDIMFIVKDIVFNARFWPYPNIVEEQDDGGYVEGKYITDLEVADIEYSPEEVWSYLNYDPVEHRAILGTDKPLIKYTFNFKWRAAAAGVGVVFGTGVAVASSKSFKATLTLPDKEFAGSVDAQFAFDIKSLNGQGASEEVKSWLVSKMNAVTANQISQGIKYNNKFLSQYIFWPYLNVQRTINGGHKVAYINTPINSGEMEGNIWVAFQMEVKLDDKEPVKLEKDYYIEDSAGLRDIATYLSPEVAGKAVDMHRQAGNLDMEYDLASWGYTGTVKDFLVPMPELALEYSQEQKVRMYCRTGEVGVAETETALTLPQSCEFTVEGATESFLDSSFTFVVPFEPSKTPEQQLFVAQLEVPSFRAMLTRPQSPDVIVFMSQLANLMGKAMLKEKLVPEPRLRYETLREFYGLEVPKRYNYYVAFYDVQDV